MTSAPVKSYQETSSGPAANGRKQSIPAFDLECVEMPGGLVGTLLGRHTPAGLVKLDSVGPGRKFQTYGSRRVGTPSTVNVEGDVNGRNITSKIVAVGDIDFNKLTGVVKEPRAFGVAFKAAFRASSGNSCRARR